MNYQCLSKQVFSEGDYALVPIRHEDRYLIMQWRNDQMYHLRQNEPLTCEVQDAYFEQVVAKLFEEDQPKQLLFSLLYKNTCIAYGGLVHIDWVNRNAEVSFLLNNQLSHAFVLYWVKFLRMLKGIAFQELPLKKIYTYAYDIRPEVYKAVEASGFSVEARLKSHAFINEDYKDVVIHSLFYEDLKDDLTLRIATIKDCELFYEWATESEVRKNSTNSEMFSYSSHKKWFKEMLKSSTTKLYIGEVQNRKIGQVRLEYLNGGLYLIGFSVANKERSKGYGFKLLAQVLSLYPERNYQAFVKDINLRSLNLFEKLGFERIGESLIHENHIEFRSPEAK